MSLGVFRGCKRKEKEGVRYYSSPYGSTEGTCCKLRFTQFGFLDSSKKPGIAVVFFFYPSVLRNTMGPSLVRLTMGDTYHIGFGNLNYFGKS